VNDPVWKWIELDSGSTNLSQGRNTVEFVTGTTGIAIDNIMVTNDLSFVPELPDNMPAVSPSTPADPKIEVLKTTGTDSPLEWRGYTIKPPYVKFMWKPSSAPQGVRYYNIYRSNTKDFKPETANLIGSTSELFFIDLNLKKGIEYHYRLVSADNWDNLSVPSAVLSVSLK